MPGTNDITYISIHAPRMGSDLPGARGHLRRGQISIHAPRMGSDAVFAMPQVWWRISIHAPRMGSDRKGNRLRSRHSKFQSTLPGWGATIIFFLLYRLKRISIHAPRMGSDLGFSLFIQWSKDFNPRSPDGERPEIVRRLLETVFISIHAPRMGSDFPNRPHRRMFHVFQSTLPGWGATDADDAVRVLVHDFNPRSPDGERQHLVGYLRFLLYISIHAPRMGSDLARNTLASASRYFNPRSPDGERLDISQHTIPFIKFQSTLPGWGATRNGVSDAACRSYFNPRSPDGERLFNVYQQLNSTDISIHAPRMGSDRENGHLRPRYGQNHPFSTLIVSQIVVDVLGTVRKSQKHQRTSHYEVIKQPERQK